MEKQRERLICLPSQDALHLVNEVYEEAERLESEGRYLKKRIAEIRAKLIKKQF